MNNYQFDFIARALLAILDAITEIVLHLDPSRANLKVLDGLQDQHADWQIEKDKENGHTK